MAMFRCGSVTRLSTETNTKNISWSSGSLATTKTQVFTFTKDVKGIAGCSMPSYQGIVGFTISGNTVTGTFVCATNSEVNNTTTLTAIV